MNSRVVLTLVVSLTFVPVQHVFAQAQQLKPIIYHMETTTDSSGNFTAPHGLSIAMPGHEGMEIVGAIVSVQSENKAWYPIYATFGGSRVAWDDKNVSGVFPDKGFRQRPVRILLFVTNIIT